MLCLLKRLRIMKFPPTISSAPQARFVAFILQIWLRRRRARAVDRTWTAISDLTEGQLRDIGLAPDHPLQEPDQHQLDWRDRLSPWLDR
jgi:hypothetical protein